MGSGSRTDMGAESKIILVPRSADAAYAYWEVAEVHRDALKAEGGRTLALRIHDATNLELDYQTPHSTQEYVLADSDRDKHVPIFVPDRDYVAELGYLTDQGNWLQLIRSLHVRVPAA
jgi:phosphate transport system substrate-binding protein